MDEKDDGVLRKRASTPIVYLTTRIAADYKEKYDILSRRGIRISEHLRRVIYPEIDRLFVLVGSEDSEQAG